MCGYVMWGCDYVWVCNVSLLFPCVFLLNVYLYCLYSVFSIVPFMYIYSPLFCLYCCTICCHQVTTQLQLIITIINNHLLSVYIWCAIHIQTMSSNITHLQPVISAATGNPSHQLTVRESFKRHGRIDPIWTVTFQSPVGHTTFTHFQ
jgi:hypothetical protein